jgi:hypothetical protein
LRSSRQGGVTLPLLFPGIVSLRGLCTCSPHVDMHFKGLFISYKTFNTVCKTEKVGARAVTEGPTPKSPESTRNEILRRF